MKTEQIADALNKMAVSEGFEIAELPQLRKKHLGKKQLPNKIFTKQTIFPSYAYHNGGRDELQFNFGEEFLNGKAITRVALCFSLEPSRSLIDPVVILKPFRKRFDELFNTNPDLFKDLKLRLHKLDGPTKFFTAQTIPDDWFVFGNFIALGKWINKPLKELNESDLREILSIFDKLLPIYNYCVLNQGQTQKKEKRISKICWNGNNWVKPSGLKGKSNDPKSYERIKGYGHEEWLFDFEKMIDGFHYGLLQPAQHGRKNFLDKIFDVKLYSRNSEFNETYWVGLIKNLEVISNEEAARIHKIYKENGWLDEMVTQIKKANGDYTHFLSLEPHECFSVRFKPENSVLFDPYKIVSDFRKIIGTYHYVFVNDESEKEKEEISVETEKRRKFSFKPGMSAKSEKDRKFKRTKTSYQIKPIHDKLQNILYDILVQKFGKENVGSETDTGNQSRIDLCVNLNNKITLYEVKSYPSVLTTIRVALGQLTEYAYYPDPIENLEEIIIVSHLPIDESDQEYLKVLRNKTGLNIYYQFLDIKIKKIT
jgi:hypothetical protein